MKKKIWYIAWVLTVGMLTSAIAEEIVLFDALGAGINPWVWDGARIAKKSNKFILTNDRKPNTSDAVFLDQRLLYLQDATVEIDIKHIRSGNFTFQLLFFKGDTYLSGTDLIKKAQTKGTFTFPLKEIDKPSEADRITFKLWVSKDTPNIELGNIRYYIQRPADDILYSQTYDVSTTFQHEQIFTDRTTDDLTIKLLTGQSSGSILINDQIPLFPEANLLVLQVEDVANGTITLQGCAFDELGNYLDSIDLAQRAGSTIAVDLKNIVWPKGTETFQCKIWLGGANAVATLNKLLLIK